MTNPISSFAHRTARWCALHPWRAILGWVAFVAFAVGLATMIPTQETTDADYRLGESGRADAMVASADFDEPDTEQVLISARSGDLDKAQAQQAAAAVVAGMTELPGVDEVAEPQVSPDGTAYLVSIQLARDQDDVSSLQEVTKAVQSDFPELQVRQSGDVSLDAAIDDRVADDLSAAETLSLPVTLILMLLAFGALIAAGIPVLLAGTSVAATVGILAPVSHLIHADSTVTSMIVLIGMAVGVDYSLFYLKREREERAKGHSTPRRRRDRGPDLGPLDPGVRCGRDLLDGRAVHPRRLDVQLARRRLDHRRRGGGARLDHGAAGAAGQARPLGGPPAGPDPAPGDPPDAARVRSAGGSSAPS